MKKKTPLQILEDVSGIKKDDVRQIFEDVKANLEALRNCPGHKFVKVEGKTSLDTRYLCSVCSGEVTSRDHQWYVRGKQDADSV